MDRNRFPQLRRLPLLGPLWADSLLDLLDVSQAAADAVFQATLRPAADQPLPPASAPIAAVVPQAPRRAA